MAFYRTVRIVRKNSSQSFKFDVNSHEGHDACEKKIRQARKMPKTERVEVIETDTQLYGLPVEQRTYLSRVFRKGQEWVLYGPNPDTAFLTRV